MKKKMEELYGVKGCDTVEELLAAEDDTRGLFRVSHITGGDKNDLRLRVDLSGSSYERRREKRM